MKNQDKILFAAFITSLFSLLSYNSTVNANNYDINTFNISASNQLYGGKSTYQFKSQYASQIIIAKSIFPLDYHAMGLDLVFTFYDTIRLKGEIATNISQPTGTIHHNTNNQWTSENHELQPTDQDPKSSETNLTDFEAINANLDLELMVPLGDSMKVFGGIGYQQQTFQHEGRLFELSDSPEGSLSLSRKATSFKATYQMIYPLIGMEKQISDDSKISAVLKFPAYAWSEYKADDPTVEEFSNSATNKFDESTGTGFSGELSINHRISDKMFLRAGVRYTKIQADSSGLTAEGYNATESLESEQLGAIIKYGITL